MLYWIEWRPAPIRPWIVTSGESWERRTIERFNVPYGALAPSFTSAEQAEKRLIRHIEKSNAKRAAIENL